MNLLRQIRQNHFNFSGMNKYNQNPRKQKSFKVLELSFDDQNKNQQWCRIRFIQTSQVNES